MRKTTAYISSIILLISSFALPLYADDDILRQTIHISQSNGTIYTIFGQISDQTGYLFFYDSQLINDEKKVKIKTGNYSIREAINLIVKNPDIKIRTKGKHIILYKPEIAPSAIVTTPPVYPTVQEKDSFLTIKGVLCDRLTNEAIPYATLNITEFAIGTVTNTNGEFRLRIPDSLRYSNLNFSHLGYEPFIVNADILINGFHQIRLEPKIIPLQEVIVRTNSPIRILEAMLNDLKNNYAHTPVYHTAFYREGILYKKRLSSLSESVFKVYKAPYNKYDDQVKLLKMRTITNQKEADTLVTRFKSGVNSCLVLDIIKHLPDFLTLDPDTPYEYTYSDITYVDNRLAYVILFEQKKNIVSPLYKGELYIDMDNNALVGARFEVNPQYVENASDFFISKKSKYFNVTAQKAAYNVSYKKWNDTYYVNHIRGDLHFKVKKKKNWFYNAPVHIWFEMVNCTTGITDVTRFSRSEKLPTQSIFAQIKYTYDRDFWENFNIIPPEEQLNEAISRISAKVEEIGY